MRRLARVLTLMVLVGGLLVLLASAAFAQDGETPAPVVDSFAAVAVQLAAAALVVQKIVERLKTAFGFLTGTKISIVAVGLGFAAAYGFDLSVGATGSELVDKLFAALTVGLGAGTINEVVAE